MGICTPFTVSCTNSLVFAPIYIETTQNELQRLYLNNFIQGLQRENFGFKIDHLIKEGEDAGRRDEQINYCNRQKKNEE